MRPIDADALFEVIKKSMAENPHKEKTQMAMHIHEHKYFLTLLTSFPTIQPEERTEKRMETHGVCLDAISRQVAVDVLHGYFDGMLDTDTVCPADIYGLFECIPSAQPETAKRIVGKERDGMTLWYQCDMCNEPVDEQDNYCRGCGRRLIDG